MPNRLAQQSSPYLLQHQDNPVDWYPWGPEALERARSEAKPIFLSIGYSACHWCHVMEHESFESPAIAAQLNEHFISIKVDREERPDIDHIYMNAVQLMTGRGGWPMSMFLTPDLKPFYGGTYWPPEPRMGMPGFSQILAAVNDAWQNRREQALDQADQMTEHLQSIGTVEDSGQGLRLALLEQAADALVRNFDSQHGGFGGAPKFPHPMAVQLLLSVWQRSGRAELRDAALFTLRKMARGGIYDHLGGGFARYSVDARWLVPHFEKMLYDNALLLGAYLDGYQATGDEELASCARETIDYLLRDMTDPLGPFYSTEDADSEGEEGKFYVWTPEEIDSQLGPERGERFRAVYDVTAAGNFEGHNILNLKQTIAQCAAAHGWDLEELSQQLAEDRAKLFAVREARVHPGKDDKVLVSWNGLMINSLARAAGILGEPGYLTAAAKAADFLLANLRRDDGRLLHTWRHGVSRHDAYLDDYAALANALVTLYEETFDERWLAEALRLTDQLLTHFRDNEAGGFFYTADDHEALIARTKDVYDSSVPSGNALAATLLIRLARLTGRAELLTAAEETMRLALGVMERSPTAAGQMLLAVDLLLGPTPEIVILGDPTAPATADVIAALRQPYLPRRVIACRSASAPEEGLDALQPLFAGKRLASDVEEPAVYICQQFTCQAPVSGRDAALALWKQLATER